MKTQFIFLMMIATIVISCNQQTKDPIEGAWKMVYSHYGEMDVAFPEEIEGSGVKLWTDECFTYAGHWSLDTIHIDSYGWGTYTLTNQTHYIETIISHNEHSMDGQSINMIIEVRNDTLIQKWPVDDNWIPVEKHNTEKYIRLK